MVWHVLSNKQQEFWNRPFEECVRKEPMRSFVVLVVLCLVPALSLVGCSGGEDETPRARETAPLNEEETAAAQTRGVPTEDYGRDEAPSPKVLLETIEYEWRTSPDKGIAVTMEFINPAETYERAKGYVFLVAQSTLGGGLYESVYPWNAHFEDGLPEDYTDGTHLLYRDSQTVRCFVPYERGDGYFNKLKLFVFSEDGKILTGRDYDLQITGEPGQSRTINPGFDI